MATEYNSEGRLPIHEAAFRNYDTIVDRILKNYAGKGGNKDEEDEFEDNRTEEDLERAQLVYQARMQEMIEATTYDYFRFTPILAATVGDARQTIECLVNHGARLNCRDGENHNMASIAIFKQNVDFFLYFAQAPFANELDLWNTLMNMFTSRILDDSLAAGRILEQITSAKHIKIVWANLSNVRVVEKTIQVLVYTVDNSSNEQLLISCLLTLYNLICIDPNIRTTFSQNDEGARAFVKMPKTNEQISLLFAHIVCQLCDDARCIHAFVRQNLIGEIQMLLDIDTINIPKNQAGLYFDILGKIARCRTEYQTLIQISSATKRSILEQSIESLERFDRQLTISILHFIRELCLQNEEQQQICADNHLLIAHLLSALNSTYRDVQRSSVDTLQMIVTHNALSQLTILQQGGAEQLLMLLNKATLPRLRISIICTLWSLTRNEPHRRQSMAYSIGITTLVEFLNLKTTDQLCIVLDAISELLRRIPTETENIPLIFGARHAVPPIVRLLSMDYEHKLLDKCLECIQRLCLLATFSPCRRNQTIVQKANGFHQILTLIRRSNKDKLIQAKAITTLACTIFDHRENKELLTKSVVQQVFKRIASLLNAADENVRIEAGAGLVTFVCNDASYYNLCSENFSFTSEYFLQLLSSANASIRCQAAFQMIILIRLITNFTAAEWMAQALLVLFRVIGDPKVDDEEKIEPTDLIGRLARIPSGLQQIILPKDIDEKENIFQGFGIYKHSGVCEAIIASDGLEHLIALLNSSNIILSGNAAVTIDRLVRDSPEGQRRLFQQCRVNKHYLTILRTHVFHSSPLRARIEESYATAHQEPVRFPPIRTRKQLQHQRRSLPNL